MWVQILLLLIITYRKFLKFKKITNHFFSFRKKKKLKLRTKYNLKSIFFFKKINKYIKINQFRDNNNLFFFLNSNKNFSQQFKKINKNKIYLFFKTKKKTEYNKLISPTSNFFFSKLFFFFFNNSNKIKKTFHFLFYNNHFYKFLQNSFLISSLFTFFNKLINIEHFFFNFFYYYNNKSLIKLNKITNKNQKLKEIFFIEKTKLLSHNYSSSFCYNRKKSKTPFNYLLIKDFNFKFLFLKINYLTKNIINFFSLKNKHFFYTINFKKISLDNTLTIKNESIIINKNFPYFTFLNNYDNINNLTQDKTNSHFCLLLLFIFNNLFFSIYDKNINISKKLKIFKIHKNFRTLIQKLIKKLKYKNQKKYYLFLVNLLISFNKNKNKFFYFFLLYKNILKKSMNKKFVLKKKKKNFLNNIKHKNNILLVNKKIKNISARATQQFFSLNPVFLKNNKKHINNNPFTYSFYWKIIKYNTFQNWTFLFSSPFFFKNIVSNSNLYFFNQSMNFFFYFYKFYNKLAINANNNIIPNNWSFRYTFYKYIHKFININKFTNLTITSQYYSLIKFIEHCSGKKCYFHYTPFLINFFSFEELLQCFFWTIRIQNFKKILGPRIFLNESIQIFFICFKLKDIYILTNWMLKMFTKMSFWKYKFLLIYVQYLIKFFFWPNFLKLGLKGIKFQLKGKISVAGNSRTRTIFIPIGKVGHSTHNNKILYKLNLIKTFTGVIGFKTWLIF